MFLFLYFFDLSNLGAAPSLTTSARPSAKNSQSYPDFFALDVGAYLLDADTQLSAVQNGGDLNGLSGLFRARFGTSIWQGLNLEPSLGALLPWRSSADGSTKEFTFQLNLDLTYAVFSFLRLRVGPGLQSILYTPGGEQVDLNNGSPTKTSPFYTPSRFAATLECTLQGGLQILFSPSISMLFELYALEVMNPSHRRWNAAATLGFVL